MYCMNCILGRPGLKDDHIKQNTNFMLLTVHQDSTFIQVCTLLFTIHSIVQRMQPFLIKGTVSLILSDSLCQDNNARFKTVP